MLLRCKCFALKPGGFYAVLYCCGLTVDFMCLLGRKNIKAIARRDDAAARTLYNNELARLRQLVKSGLQLNRTQSNGFVR